MKQFWTVLKFELNNYFKNKSFVVTTFILALVIAAVIVVPTFIPGLLSDEPAAEEGGNVEEVVEDDTETDILGLYLGKEAGITAEFVTSAFPAEWTTYDEKEEMRDAVKEGTVDAGFVIESPTEVTYVVNDLGMMDYLSDTFSMTLAQCYKQQYLMEKGLTAEEILTSESFSVNVTDEVLGTDSEANYWSTYALVFVVYFLIIFYGQMIATAVTTEKSNRAIEILVTSVNPNSLICGKVLAGAIAGILQAGIIIGSGFAAYGFVGDKWGGMLDMLFDIPADVLIVYAILALLSYVLYAFVFGMLGALVSKTEDISKSSSPVLMIYVVSFMIAMFSLMDSNNIVVKVASYIPFTSGNAMFIRYSMGSVAMWEVVVSILILAASCAIAGVLAAKIFRFGTLHYGNPIKLKTALKKAKEQV